MLGNKLYIYIYILLIKTIYLNIWKWTMYLVPGNGCYSTIEIFLSVDAVMFLFAAPADSWLYVNVLMCIYNRSILWWSVTGAEHKHGSGLIFSLLLFLIPSLSQVIFSSFGFRSLCQQDGAFYYVRVCVCMCEAAVWVCPCMRMDDVDRWL